MKTLFFAGLSTVLLATSAWCQDFSPLSKVDAVTVYPQGADVTRLATFELPSGSHRILFSGLPAGIDPQSIRVEGSGATQVEVASVDARDTYVGLGNATPEQVALNKQIAALGDERALLDTVIADSNHQRTFLLNLADKQLTPSSTVSTSKDINASELGSLLDLVGQKLTVLAEKTQKAQVRQREIDELVNDLSMKLNELHAKDRRQTDVAINVEASQSTSLTLKVSYRVANAGWQPSYDARLALGKAGEAAKLSMDRRAVVSQSTDESWQDITMTLSTAQPTGLTAAPEVWEAEVGLPVPAPLTIGEADVPMDAMKDDRADNKIKGGLLAKPEVSAAAASQSMVVQKQAEIVQAGFQANYVISGRVNVDNSGQAKKLKISSSKQEVKLSAVTSPRFDVTAYLTAEFSSDAAGPQLAGPVNLYRDGIYVGQGYLPQLAPAEKVKLGFGADSLIKVTRAEVKRLTGDEGIISSSHTDERAWDVTVSNMHDFVLPVTVVDRVPFTSIKDVTISEVPGMTEPTTRNLDKKRGVLAWTLEMEAGAEKTIKTGYKISWPEGVQIGLVD